MNTACECGMTLERSSSRIGCQECGTIRCKSCLIKVAANTFCRWCATSLAP